MPLRRSLVAVAMSSLVAAAAVPAAADEIVPLLSFDPGGMMLLAKASGAGKVAVKGTLVDAVGKPLAGKTVCAIASDGKVKGVVADLPGGQLTVVTTTSTATGAFQLAIPRFAQLAVSPCKVTGVEPKLEWRPALAGVDVKAGAIDLGAVGPTGKK